MKLIQKLERVRTSLIVSNMNASACNVDEAITALKAAEKMAEALKTAQLQWATRYEDLYPDGAGLDKCIHLEGRLWREGEDALRAWNEATK